jgi:glycosyltransferase involved in cell wall biosynthesis
MGKLALCSNFQDEILNLEPIWNTFKDIIDLWVVVDSGSTDGTQDKLKELAGDRLRLIESDMIKTNGYGYARTKLIEYSEGVDFVLIWDGDERMMAHDVKKVKFLVEYNPDVDIIFLPRCHYQKWDMSVVEYGSMTVTGPDWNEAIRLNADWQPRLIRRTMIDGKSKVHFQRRVHELVQGVDRQIRNIDNPVIRHFGFLKPPERLKMVSYLCQTLWKADQAGTPMELSYEQACKENGWKP